MTDLETRTAPEAVKEPQKRWRNWWRATEPMSWICRKCGHEEACKRGSVAVTHCFSYPSRDVAESVAARGVEDGRVLRMEYLGAFPEGERP